MADEAGEGYSTRPVHRACGAVRQDDRERTPQDFRALNSAKRRLWNTVVRIVKGRAADCCAISTARSRAATTTNLARSSLALVFCNFVMIRPDDRLGGWRTPSDDENLPLIRGHLMAGGKTVVLTTDPMMQERERRFFKYGVDDTRPYLGRRFSDLWRCLCCTSVVNPSADLVFIPAKAL
jgi:hypothetical protein